MFRAVWLQAMAVVLASVACGVAAGLRGSVSSALGGLAYLFPNLLFALHLKLAVRYSGAGFLVNFLLGEVVKLALIIGLFFAAVLGYDDAHMPSLLIGLAFAAQAVFFLGFWKKKKHGDHS